MVTFFSFLFIPCVQCKISSLGKCTSSLSCALIREHRQSVFLSQILELESFSIDLFYLFHFLFFIFSHPKLHFYHP